MTLSRNINTTQRAVQRLLHTGSDYPGRDGGRNAPRGDNEGDILLTTEALADSKIANTISVARDGASAVDFLNKRPPFEEAEIPDLILDVFCW